jgi:positive regulator of sigma E activity
MTATVAELAFSVFFLMFMNASMLFAMLPEEKCFSIMQVIAESIARFVTQNFPRREEGQTTSQPELILSVRSQPVVRLAS